MIGENGAGKSTLMNILAGDLQPDEGELRHRRQGDAFRFAARQPRRRHRRRLSGARALPDAQRRREHHDVGHGGAARGFARPPRRDATRGPRGARQARHGQSRPRRQGGPAQDRRDATGRDRGRGPTARPSARARRAELGAFQARERAAVRTRQAAAKRGRHRHLRLAPPPGGARSRRSHHGHARRPHRRDARKRQYSGRSPDTRHGRSGPGQREAMVPRRAIRKAPTSCWR